MRKTQKIASLDYVLLSLEEKKSFASKLDRAIRQNILLVYINLNLQEVIFYVFGKRLDIDSNNYNWVRNKMLENTRSYKSKVCAQFKLFVYTLVKQDATLLELSNKSFGNKVGDLFSATNYFYCFYFIKNYLNVKGSSDLRKQFLKSIFVNLAVRVRKQLKLNNELAQIGNQDKVLDFYDEVALLLAYDNIDITDFQQLTQKFRNAKASKKRDFTKT